MATSMPPAPPEDWSAVLTALLGGDRLAFAKVNRLVTSHLRHLRAYDFRDEWDDLRQEVVMSIVANATAGRLREPQAFLGYVRVLTRNKFIDRLRAHLRVGEHEPLPWDDETARMPAAPTADDTTAELWAAVRDLDPDEQRVVHGVYREGKTYQQVSDDTGIPLGTMKRRLRDALVALRRRFAIE